MVIQQLEHVEIFSAWRDKKIDDYSHSNQELNAITKYMAEIGSVIYGNRLKKGVKLHDVLESMNFIQGYRPTPGTFRVWRTQGPFKEAVNELRAKFSDFFARNLVCDKARAMHLDVELGFGESSPAGIKRKIRFSAEAIGYYPPELVDSISDKIIEMFDSGDSKKTPSETLGYLIWCLLLLRVIKVATPKSESRKTYLEIGKKIIGYHWGKNSGKATEIENYFSKNNIEALSRVMEREYVSIVNQGICNLESRGDKISTDGLRVDDLTEAVDFLVSEYVIGG